MDNKQTNQDLPDDKENMNTDYSYNEANKSIPEKQFYINPQMMIINQQSKVIRIGTRSPFQQINMESIKNISNSNSSNQQNEKKTQIIGLAEHYYDIYRDESKDSLLKNLNSQTSTGHNGNSLNLSTREVLKNIEGSDQKESQNSIDENMVKTLKGQSESLIFSDSNHSGQNIHQLEQMDQESKQLLVQDRVSEKEKAEDNMEIEKFEQEHVSNVHQDCLEEEEMANQLGLSKRNEDFEIEINDDDSSLRKIQDDSNLNHPNISNILDTEEIPKGINSMEILNEHQKNINSGDIEKSELVESNEINYSSNRISRSKSQGTDQPISNSNDAPNQTLDLELEQQAAIISDLANNSQEISDLQESGDVNDKSMRRSMIDLKAMSKGQIMKNLQDLIEANNSSIASGDSTPATSQANQMNLNISESTKKRNKTRLKEAYGPSNVTISSSISSLPRLKTSIHQSLRALRGVVQDSKADSQNADQTRYSSLIQSISSMEEARKKYQDKKSFGNFDGILRELEQETKLKHLDPLDLIIQEKLDSDFKIKSIKKHQSDAVKRILSKESCVYRHTSTGDKNLVYQLPAVLTKGLVIYISTSVSRMAEQIPLLPQSISGACYNNISSKENNDKIIDLVQKGDVKMLYITPDKLAELLKYDIPKIGYAVIDEFSFNEDQNSCQMQLNPLLKEMLSKQGAFWTKLVLVPPTSKKIFLNACEIYNISNQLILPVHLTFDTIPNISISRDEETNKALLSLLRNQKFSNGQCVLVYTSQKRVAEEISVTLTQNGIKNQLVLQGKNEAQKFELYNSFIKNTDQAIVTVSGTELGFDKGLLRRTVHFNMPRTPERFAQEVLYLSKQAKCHIFVTDEEYFRERNNSFSNFIYPDQITKFLDKVLLSSNNSSGLIDSSISIDKLEAKNAKNSSTAGNNKLNIVPISNSLLEKRKRDGSCISNKNPSTTQSNTYLSKFLSKAKVEQQELKPNNEILSLKASEIAQHLKLSREGVASLFEQFDKFTDWIEYNGMNPYTISVRFVPSVNNVNLKTGPKALSLQSIWQLLQSKSKKFTGVIRIVVPELAAEMKILSAEVLKQMKSLQNDGFLRYDILEEVFQYRIKQIPNTQDIQDVINKIHDYLARKVYKAIRDIDCCYSACKQFAVQKVDHLSRQRGSIKTAACFRNSSNYSLKPTKDNSQCCSDDENDMQDDPLKESYKTALKQKLIQRIEEYINNENIEKSLSVEQISKSNEELPVLRITSQRDKSLMYTELQGFIAYYFDQTGVSDSAVLDPKGLMSEELQQLLCRQAVRVAIGIPPANSSNEWRTCKFWGRYSKYDPFELNQLFSEVIESIVAGYKQIKKI